MLLRWTQTEFSQARPNYTSLWSWGLKGQWCHKIFKEGWHKMSRGSNNPSFCLWNSFTQARQNILTPAAVTLVYITELVGCRTRFWGLHKSAENKTQNNASGVRGKASPLQAWTGPYRSRRLWFPEFLDNQHMMAAR